MATYRNKRDDTIIRGSEFKLNISMDVIDSYHMGDVNFFCTFNAGGKVVLLTKEDMIEVDADNYLAPLDSNDFNKGVMCIRYEADIPDEAFADGFRHVKIDIPTKITIR